MVVTGYRGLRILVVELCALRSILYKKKEKQQIGIHYYSSTQDACQEDQASVSIVSK